MPSTGRRPTSQPPRERRSGTRAGKARPRPASSRSKKPAGRAPVAYKANVGKRVGAAFLDVLLAGVVGLVFVIWGWWQVTAILIAAYLLVRDGLAIPALDNQSVGKKLTLIQVEMKASGDARLDLATSVKRNLSLASGFLVMPIVGMLWLPLGLLVAAAPAIVELVLVLKDPEGLRYGDQLAGTKVLD